MLSGCRKTIIAVFSLALTISLLSIAVCAQSQAESEPKQSESPQKQTDKTAKQTENEQKQPESTQMNCDSQRALLLIGQQIDEARNLDNPAKQIPVFIRAADLLWPRQQKTAREVFTNAFDLAERRFKEKGDESRREGRMIVQVQDARFSVMEAIARHDPAWAKQLAEQIVDEDRRDAEAAKDTATKTNAYADTVGSKILGMAMSLASTNPQSAVTLARDSFRYPAGYMTGAFLYALAQTNQAVADQFYTEALTAYANAPINEFFYLSAYPFVRERYIGPEAFHSAFSVPPRVTPNPQLQQLFLDALMRRADAALKAPESTPAGSDPSSSETAQLFVAFSQLETLLPQYQPAYLDRIIALKPALGAMLNADVRQEATSQLQQQAEQGDGRNLERNLDKAERESNPAVREQYYAFAIIMGANSNKFDIVLGLLQKIDDSTLRTQLSNFIYFKRTQKAVKEKQFDDAARFAEKVEQLDLRAYLAYEIASASLKEMQDRTRAKEVLDDVVKLAEKAANTNEKVRALLGVAYLYAQFDSLRAFEVMRDAVHTINQVSEPDFASSNVMQKIEGKNFSHFAGYSVEGFSLEKGFRLLGPYDFDGVLLMARSFDDKALRATATLALATVCLDNAPKAKKPDETKEPAMPDSLDKPKTPASKKRNPQ